MVDVSELFQIQTVRDLAERFADGRLTTEKLLNADDDELHELLTEVRGIGKVSLEVSSINKINTNVAP